MNIVIDIRPLMGGKISGIEIYLKNLLKYLLELDKENTYILFANASKDQNHQLPQFQQENIVTLQTKIPNKLLNLSLFLFKRPLLDVLILRHLYQHPHLKPKNYNGRGIDLFFMPDLRMSALSKGVKKITVVHDLSFHHFPQFFSWKTRLWYKLLRPKKELHESKKIIAVSAFTKDDLVKTYHISPLKIEVIHEGIAQNFCQNISGEELKLVRKKYNLPERYFLFLSTIEPRKNVQRLIHAFFDFKSKNPQDRHQLVIAGAQNKKIFSKVEFLQSPQIILPGFIEEEDKGAVIKNASAFIYPSLFEGFGLPLLEGMKCGTPLITSNRSSMPEIVGESALLVNPEKTEEITQALEKILQPGIKSKLQIKMAQQIKKYNWQKCTEETLNIFKQI